MPVWISKATSVIKWLEQRVSEYTHVFVKVCKFNYNGKIVVKI